MSHILRSGYWLVPNAHIAGNLYRLVIVLRSPSSGHSNKLLEPGLLAHLLHLSVLTEVDQNKDLITCYTDFITSCRPKDPYLLYWFHGGHTFLTPIIYLLYWFHGGHTFLAPIIYTYYTGFMEVIPFSLLLSILIILVSWRSYLSCSYYLYLLYWFHGGHTFLAPIIYTYYTGFMEVIPFLLLLSILIILVSWRSYLSRSYYLLIILVSWRSFSYNKGIKFATDQDFSQEGNFSLLLQSACEVKLMDEVCTMPCGIQWGGEL